MNADVMLKSLEDLDAALSDPRPLLIFKHSTACPISAGALEEFDAWQRTAKSRPRTAIVRVIEERPVSNAIAQRFGVIHKSPQALLVKGGAVLWQASHRDITAKSLAGAQEPAG